MQITEITKIGKGIRYKLEVDYNFEGVFEAEVLARYNLQTGQEIDEDFYGSTEFNEDEFDAAGFDEMNFDEKF